MSFMSEHYDKEQRLEIWRKRIMNSKMDTSISRTREILIYRLIKEFPYMKGKIEHILEYSGYWRDDGTLSEFGETYLSFFKDRNTEDT